jgi:hypothetical protein
MLGLRAWGLILYGTLPASLAGVGVIKFPELKAARAELLVPLLAIALLPIVVLYLLIRQRLSAFYLLSEGLWVRSSLVTVGIVLLSSLVSGAAGVVRGQYELIAPSTFFQLDVRTSWRPIVEAFLMGSVMLVGSTTLFLTAVKEAGGLPALPSAEFVKDIGELRVALWAIQRHAIWTDPKQADSKALSDHVVTARQASARLAVMSPLRSGRRHVYTQLQGDLQAFEAARQQAANVPVKWTELFAAEDPRGINEADRARRAAARTLKALPIG